MKKIAFLLAFLLVLPASVALADLVCVGDPLVYICHVPGGHTGLPGKGKDRNHKAADCILADTEDCSSCEGNEIYVTQEACKFGHEAYDDNDLGLSPAGPTQCDRTDDTVSIEDICEEEFEQDVFAICNPKQVWIDITDESGPCSYLY